MKKYLPEGVSLERMKKPLLLGIIYEVDNAIYKSLQNRYLSELDKRKVLFDSQVKIEQARLERIMSFTNPGNFTLI